MSEYNNRLEEIEEYYKKQKQKLLAANRESMQNLGENVQSIHEERNAIKGCLKNSRYWIGEELYNAIMSHLEHVSQALRLIKLRDPSAAIEFVKVTNDSASALRNLSETYKIVK